ncbi:hypothetical protein [Nostoc sp. PA-18-2419]|uniref:hypothetical protein n=1 Tax=Nostoc sp. PA-18-2419 TaxID=2575443 RepID=UPI001109BEA0|nr:hypothetical protein [Nostoc sp. PA-18-2419]
MKFHITEQTPKLLKLQLKPQATFYWLFGGIFIIGGVFLIAALGKATSFSCSRVGEEANICQLTTKNLLTTQTQSWHFQEIVEAKLDTTTTDAWGSYPFVLQTTHGSVLINLLNADSTKKEAKAAQINTFLKIPQEQNLTIGEDSRLWTYPLGLLMIAVGAVCIASILRNKKIICVVDKTVGKITIERQSWLGNQILEAKLSEIVTIELNSFEFDNILSYNIRLILADNHHIDLATASIFTATTANQIKETLTSFINL